MNTSFERTSSFFCSSPFFQKEKYNRINHCIYITTNSSFKTLTENKEKNMEFGPGTQQLAWTLVSPASPIILARPACTSKKLEINWLPRWLFSFSSIIYTATTGDLRQFYMDSHLKIERREKDFIFRGAPKPGQEITKIR